MIPVMEDSIFGVNIVYWYGTGIVVAVMVILSMYAWLFPSGKDVREAQAR